MRKELIIAIALGSIIGLVIAFGVWRANNIFKQESLQSPKEKAKSVIQEVTKSKNSSSEFAISSPQEFDLQTTDSAVIAGLTKAGNVVVASTADEDYFTKAEDTGEFKIEVELEGGINQVIVTSYENVNTSESKTISVVYSSQFETNTDSKELSEEDTEETSDEIRQKVQEKLREAENSPKAFWGTITDISEEAIQIRADNGEIKQIAVSQDTTDFVKSLDDTGTIEFADIAIGDFILALGHLDGNEVLETQRLIVTQVPSDLSLKILGGSVSEIVDSRELTLSSSGTSWTVEFPRTWTGPDLDELEEGQEVIVIGTPSAESLEDTRTIQLFSELQALTQEE